MTLDLRLGLGLCLRSQNAGLGLAFGGFGLSRILGHGSSPIFASVEVVKLTIAYYCH